MKILKSDLSHTIRKKTTITLDDVDIAVINTGGSISVVEGYSHIYVVRKEKEDEREKNG